jgi:hypothetical protein
MFSLRSSDGRRHIVSLHAARVGDLGPGDFVKAECMACGHTELVPTIGLTAGLRLPPETRILDLEPRLRCRECDAKGKAVVTVRWAG